MEEDAPILSSEDAPILISDYANVRYNTKIVYIISSFSYIGGFLCGYDIGIISGALLFLKGYFNLNTISEAFVVSVSTGATCVFSLFNGFLNYHVGRKLTIIIAGIIFMISSLVLACAVNYYMLLFGRILIGVAIGFEMCTVPIYLSEISPVKIRGQIVSMVQVSITLGVLVASLIVFAFCHHSQSSWRYMFGLGAIPALIQIIAFMFLPESPRWLVLKNRNDEAMRVLRKIYTDDDDDDDDDNEEINNIMQNNEAIVDSPIISQILKTKHVMKALFVGSSLQLTKQFIGINSIIYYSFTIINMSGMGDMSSIFWISSIIYAVRVLFSTISMYLISKFRRRTLIIASLFGTLLSSICIALSFQLESSRVFPVTYSSFLGSNSSCSEYISCQKCINDEYCGFCYGYNGKDLISSCMQSNNFSKDVNCGNFFEKPYPSIQFVRSSCPMTMIRPLVIGMVLFVATWEFGIGPLASTINSEIYPLWARSTAMSITSSLNYLGVLIITFTFLPLSEIIGIYNVFWTYAIINLIGIVIIYKYLPETKNICMEEIEKLFKIN